MAMVTNVGAAAADNDGAGDSVSDGDSNVWKCTLCSRLK